MRAERADRESAALKLTLTIIVPAYNEEAGLSEVLESIQRQTVPVDHVIVVDDGSTDRTSEIAGRYPMVELLRREVPTGSKARAQRWRGMKLVK